MVNHFADQMPRPIVGVAHSMGCAQLQELPIHLPYALSTNLLQASISPYFIHDYFRP